MPKPNEDLSIRVNGNEVIPSYTQLLVDAFRHAGFTVKVDTSKPPVQAGIVIEVGSAQ